MSNYINTLNNASAFTPEVQSAASALAPSKDALQAAIDAAIAAPESDDTLTGEQADLLKKGFEYATQVVKMLDGEPATDEKLDLYKYFKRANDETPAAPSVWQFEAKYKYNAWKEISHISQQKAQVLYIKQVDTLLEKYGARS
ncbi:acyl-CoA-binding protein (ACBP)/diazepam binding inhibitor (DBI)/endozepine (EP) [Elasticomyces elasticus]|nr:acyl-CoA-binding protein (ACBP)/diazepam binding inhibitor (DBI)/endozepine (EP) [Elasticomyces elasticus]